MQIEQGLLCFKIGEIDGNRSATRDFYHKRFMAHCAGRNEIRRPDHFGSGSYMTIAVVNRTDWLGSDDSLVDMNKVVARLNDYESLYLQMINKLQFENTAENLTSSQPTNI